MGEMVSTREAARRLGVTKMTLSRWIRKGCFPGAYKLDPEIPNSHYCIPIADVVAMERRRQGTGA